MTPNFEIQLRPSAIFALIHVFYLLVLTMAFLVLAYFLSPVLTWLSLASAIIACCRYMIIRSACYTITPETIKVQKGILFRRTDQVEMYHVKDYILLQPLLFQAFRLMNLILKSTDPQNPVLYLRGIPRSNLVGTIGKAVREARKVNKIVELNQSAALD